MNFIESWFQVSLDHGDGSLEFLFLVAASTFFLLFGLRRQILTKINRTEQVPADSPRNGQGSSLVGGAHGCASRRSV